MIQSLPRTFRLFLLWGILTFLFGLFTIDQRHDLLSEQLEQQAQSLSQGLSQRADQHDAHLTNLSALVNTGEIPPLAQMVEVAQTVQKFYPRILAIDVISLNPDSPLWIMTTRPRDQTTELLALTIKEAAVTSTGALALLPLGDLTGLPLSETRGQYLLVKRSPNSPAARYGLALTIDSAQLVTAETSFSNDVDLWLDLPSGENILSPAGNASSVSNSSLTESWMTRLISPDALTFEQQLGSQSQPLTLRVKQSPPLNSLLPLTVILGFSALLALALLGGNTLLKQRSATRDAQAKALLGRQEARIAQASRINSLGEMASGIAHELNQPLTAILSQSQASLHLLKSTPLKRDALISALEANVLQSKRAGEILTRLRNWTKRDATVVQLIDLNQIIRGVVDLMNTDLKERNIVLQLKLDNQPLLSKCDPVQIEQVIFNLVRNSAEAIEDQKDDIRRIAVESRAQGNQNIIQISDSGCGIPSETLPRLFEPFHSTKENGMGLGLSLSESILQRFDGTLTLINQSGGGACATVSLPSASPAAGKK
ncbi:ATP-binding protein [Kiloniella laminariae]|uniref:histidine kinase n=1 Tax=Kiloniella laminariae TaxID=454162 RepID=A0ABT4LP83_9PROT|nr:ATP-binding protein [Kiloniella laminariae]MCZ4282939.1 ATP-binding protein [Kiloniella laminariae]